MDRSSFRKTILFFIGIIFSIELHESMHWAVGHALGIPAHFFSWTSVGIPLEDVKHYTETQLVWMNGVAPIFSVFIGWLSYAHIKKLNPHTLAYECLLPLIMGIPYASLQMMICILPSSFSGQGVDSSVICQYLHLSDAVRHDISLLGFLLMPIWAYYLEKILPDTRPLERLPASTFLGVPSYILTCLLIIRYVRYDGDIAKLAQSWCLLGIIALPWKNFPLMSAHTKTLAPILLAAAGSYGLSLLLNEGDFWIHYQAAILPCFFLAIGIRQLKKMENRTAFDAQTSL